MTGEAQEAGDGVPHDGAAAVAEEQGTNRVGAHEFHLHPRAGAVPGTPPISGAVNHLLKAGKDPNGVKPQVDEPRRRHLHRSHRAVEGKALGQLPGNLQRRSFQGPCQLQAEA